MWSGTILAGQRAVTSRTSEWQQIQSESPVVPVPTVNFFVMHVNIFYGDALWLIVQNNPKMHLTGFVNLQQITEQLEKQKSKQFGHIYY